MMPLRLEPVTQALPFDERHHIVQHPGRLSGVEQRENVGVGQLGGDLDLLQEALRSQRRRQVVAEDLDGDLAVVLEIARQIHGGHAAAADFSVDGVAVGEG
jgi:hypothetical protein